MIDGQGGATKHRRQSADPVRPPDQLARTAALEVDGHRITRCWSAASVSHPSRQQAILLNAIGGPLPSL